MPKQKITEHNQEICARYEQGESTAVIAEALGVSPSVVQYRLREAGVKMRRGAPRGPRQRHRRPFAMDEMSAIVTAYLAGVTINDLRAQYGTGWSQIAAILKEHGVFRERLRHGWDKESREARDAALCQMYNDGASLAEVAAEVGLSGSVVSKVLRANGVETRGVKRDQYRREFTPEQIADMASRYETGTPASELAREHGCSQGPIERVLIAAGVYEHGRSRVGSRYTPAERQEIAARYEAGESIHALSKSLNIIPQSVHRILRSLGVEMRSNGGQYKGYQAQTEGGYVRVRPDKDDPIAAGMSWANGYLVEHRLVMAHHLGRPLRDEENVHHINGDRTDNRIENLELWSTSQPKGQRVEDKITWALEYLGQYGTVSFEPDASTRPLMT